jgi:hypothetical protein
MFVSILHLRNLTRLFRIWEKYSIQKLPRTFSSLIIVACRYRPFFPFGQCVEWTRSEIEYPFLFSNREKKNLFIYVNRRFGIFNCSSSFIFNVVNNHKCFYFSSFNKHGRRNYSILQHTLIYHHRICVHTCSFAFRRLQQSDDIRR